MAVDLREVPLKWVPRAPSFSCVLSKLTRQRSSGSRASTKETKVCEINSLSNLCSYLARFSLARACPS